MEYQPGLPEHNDNVSHQRPGREFLSLMAAVAVLALLTVWLSGLAVDWAVAKVDPKMEAALLARLSESVQPSGTEHANEQQQLESLLQPLISCVKQPYAIKLQVVEDDAANAFALPGGQMWLTTGLLSSGLSENALSFVLAHELAHFANRDHLRGLGRGLVLWVISRSVLGGETSVGGLLDPSLLLGQAQHSQAQESNSDTVALAALQCRYGHVGGATEFFEYLQLSVPEALPGVHYFESHPQLQMRIDSLNSQAESAGLVVGPVLPTLFAE